MNPIKIYYSHPFSGRTLREILDRDEVVLAKIANAALNNQVLIQYINPVRGHLIPEKFYHLDWEIYHRGPLSKTEYKDIWEWKRERGETEWPSPNRDMQDTIDCDIVFVDLSCSPRPSLGCAMEIAWGKMLNKPIYVLRGPGTEHPLIKTFCKVYDDLDSLIEAMLNNAKEWSKE